MREPKGIWKQLSSELEALILEFGVGVLFVSRQKRIAIDGRDYCLDL